MLLGAVLWLLLGAGAAESPPLPGDAATFAGDVTVDDGSVVRSGESFVKTWALRNTGTVAWEGRTLLRLPDRSGCRSPDRVPVPATAPGETVQLSVPVQAPPGPAACYVAWKVVDDRDRPFFPLSRPLHLEITVAR